MSSTTPSSRPLSPHLQVYRPQLTSVLSISHRATGVVNFLGLIALVYWLASAAAGPEAYASAMALLTGPLGVILAFGATYAFCYHLCNGIRHLLWDTGRNFEIAQIYRSGWIVVGASVVLTLILWLGIIGIGGGA
ncbi:MAG: succinate dehydrogenase, cytochrome b556 subunit [Pseudomonadota bacterium]